MACNAWLIMLRIIQLVARTDKQRLPPLSLPSLSALIWGCALLLKHCVLLHLTADAQEPVRGRVCLQQFVHTQVACTGLFLLTSCRANHASHLICFPFIPNS
jgi:hypothetical protein